MKPPSPVLVFALVCFWASPACVMPPKRVPKDLWGGQPVSENVTPGTADSGMIVWKQPVFPKPSSPHNPTSAYSSQRCGGILGTLIQEYKDVNGRDMQMIHGTTVASQFSGSDFWGTHRFSDWNIVLSPEADDQVFLSTANSLFQGGWEDDTLVAERVAKNNPNLDQFIEFEWDSGFFAPELAPGAGDETVTVGRWIFDCGHESVTKQTPPKSLGFRAEIHAPEILLSSHLIESDPNRIQARFKFFAGSRSGPLDTITTIFFVAKFFASHKNPLGGRDYSADLRPPGDGWKIASCTATEGTPSGGRPKRIQTIVQSDDGGKSLTLMLPAKGVSSGRIESSKIVDVTWVRQDSSPSGGITQCESPAATH